MPDINVNARDEYGDTPLHKAIQEGTVECVKLLLGHKYIDVNIGNENNHILLQLMEDLYNHDKHTQEIIDLLKQHGAI